MAGRGRYKCKYCGTYGHNVRTCPNNPQTVLSKTQLKKKGKLPTVVEKRGVDPKQVILLLCKLTIFATIVVAWIVVYFLVK